ncbi:uncharacterized protein K444DRAFT_248724 [Hyaloscypha bicolor E]|uniref:Aminoglycoside phosphotransferase domain-containing protein n=1 Tax=Hyaloscypha bicolor E TaxID=1095630 RepID=A0A2J6SMH0_9HELO|nr:uncharacterized protein K444DRAFT_248724 [Hyaloscypha bicolor E]PMD51971.1 hypothetical protein K444DRAFT_248724 [Hyaloscypha bicolor E]
MKMQLDFAETTPLVDGWKSNPTLQTHLQSFLKTGIPKVLSGFSLTNPALVHGDLDLHNILFDPKSNRHTAILDFNFAHVASAADEDFSSFPSIHGLLMGSLEVKRWKRYVKRCSTVSLPLPLPR